MFVLCPHCEFLVGVDPRTGQPPSACPKCGQALETMEAETTPAPAAAAMDAPVAPADAAAPIEPAPVEHAPVEHTTAAPAGDPPAQQLSADAVIAAMAAKPRKVRAKPRTDGKQPPQEAPAPARRKRAARPAAPAPVASSDTPPPAVRAGAAPASLAARLATWWSARRAPEPPAPAPPTPAPKRKASVRPIPSLRDRAVAREAAKRAAPLPEIEALSIGEMPSTPVGESSDIASTNAGNALNVEAPIVEAPIVEAAAEAPIVEAPIVEAPIVEAPAVEPLLERAIAPTVAADIPAPSPLPPTEPRVAVPPRTTTPAPSFLRARTASAAPRARWRHIATLAGLGLLLAVQLLLAQRDALAADARWRPTIDALCGALRCAVPAWRQPDAFTMLSRDVRPHPRAPGTLQIDASFRNDARWAQPWPRLVVSLADVDGRVLGTRAFTAAEYLGAPPTQNTLASGQAAAIHLAVVEPAPGVVAFSFEFR